ncbi:MoaD/ThiS family protein [Aurantibacter sp.]|uniref:MoaD/ThiS family protein n=1 Tax=Aurantibacter sp. TaxID=2807103 RepID=UPI003267E6E6
MELLLFGIAKDIVGKSNIDLSQTSALPNSVADIKVYLTKEYPDFLKLSSFAVAVNSEYATDDIILKDDDEIAIIPPVSGG